MQRKDVLAALKENSSDELRFLGHHLVSLAGTYEQVNDKGEPIGQPQTFLYPGWILSVREVWCLVTAGHILEDLDEHLHHKKIKLTSCYLIDSLGPNPISTHPIPFDYQRTPKFYIHNEEAGLDFGLIALSSYYKELLESNTILPVSEKDWIQQDKIEFGQYVMLGFPKELIEDEFQQQETNDLAILDVYPAVLWITKLDNLPFENKRTTYPRFIGKLNDDIPLESIKGMSGGPIFGFSKDNSRYWIVAVQSSWLPEQKIIFGCPVTVFASIVENLLASND